MNIKNRKVVLVLYNEMQGVIVHTDIRVVPGLQVEDDLQPVGLAAHCEGSRAVDLQAREGIDVQLEVPLMVVLNDGEY